MRVFIALLGLQVSDVFGIGLKCVSVFYLQTIKAVYFPSHIWRYLSNCFKIFVSKCFRITARIKGCAAANLAIAVGFGGGPVHATAPVTEAGH